jgi:hypothetical protein
VYLLDTSSEGLAHHPATTLESVIDRSLQVVMAFHLQCALERYTPEAAVVVMRSEHGLAATGSDFRHTAQLIATGRRIAERVLSAPQVESDRAIRRGRATILSGNVAAQSRAANASLVGPNSKRWDSFAAVISIAIKGRLKEFARSAWGRTSGARLAAHSAASES